MISDMKRKEDYDDCFPRQEVQFRSFNEYYMLYYYLIYQYPDYNYQQPDLQFNNNHSKMDQYNPLQWPPNINLAELHYNCSKPGIDNTEGAKCPCCNRYQKLENSKWPQRNIAKDFKNYGGGIPGYFYLILYFIACLLLLTLLKTVYHIIVLEQICPHLQQDPSTRCVKYLGLFKFCSAEILYSQLMKFGYSTSAYILTYLNLASYIILVIATIGIKVFLQYLNQDKISLDQKLFSKYSLIIKNVPLYYQLSDLKQQLKSIDPSVQINQIFYLHKYCKYEKEYREIFCIYFKILHLQQQIKGDESQEKIKLLKQSYEKYIELYQYVQDPHQIKNNSKKILVVFNTIEHKQKIHQKLKMNGLYKFVHYTLRLFKSKMQPINYYSQRTTEPQQILWKNIGQSSTKKQKVRIQTTIIGIGFMFISFAVLYFPMYWIDEEKAYKPGLGAGLGTLISVIIIILAIVYRIIIVNLMPTRRPSSKLAQSFFIILTTIVFHFFFYVITPATFYVFAQNVNQNEKLRIFFTAVFIFCLMVLLVAALDLKHRFFNKKKEKLLSQVSQSSNYCQQTLHEQLTSPSFPIQFKLMVIFNIWSFNSFYIFQIPYLIFCFMIVLTILYWIDKRNLYLHYKTQQYISIQLEVKVQKTYIIFFLICVSGGYYLSTAYVWQQISIGVIFILAIIVNLLLNISYKKHKDGLLRYTSKLQDAIKQSSKSFIFQTHLNMMQQELKTSFLAPIDINEFSTISLASATISYGYLETYKLFQSQFKNKMFNAMLRDKYNSIRKSKSMFSDYNKIKQNQLSKYDGENSQLRQPLINSISHENFGQYKIKIQQPSINIIQYESLKENIIQQNVLNNDQSVIRQQVTEKPIFQNIPQASAQNKVDSLKQQKMNIPENNISDALLDQNSQQKNNSQ